MIYKFMTTEDNAVIVHSELKEDGTVMVYVEKPDIKDRFHHMTCSLPSYSVTTLPPKHGSLPAWLLQKKYSAFLRKRPKGIWM